MTRSFIVPRVRGHRKFRGKRQNSFPCLLANRRAIFEPLESRLMLTGPRVVSVQVAGTSWTPDYLATIEAAGDGNGAGYAIPVGSSAQLKDLPWTNLNQIQIAFNEDVNVQEDSLKLLGHNAAQYSFSSFSYDAATATATWTLSAPIGNDNLQIDLDGRTPDGVSDESGNLLDGEWINSKSVYPSGNGMAGGSFIFAFNVLPGDVNQDGIVNGADIAGVASHWEQTGTIFDDLAGAGFVNGQGIATIASGWLTAPNAPQLMLTTNTEISASTNSVTLGQLVALTATVSSSYAVDEGNVTFYDGTTAIGTVPVTADGVATGNFSLPLGTQVTTAAYSDPGNNFGSSASTVNPSALIYTIAGDGDPAVMSYPSGIVVDGAGDVFFSDNADELVREIHVATGQVTTVAGTGTYGFNGDGLATSSELADPNGLALDSQGNLYIADTANNRIREVVAINGQITPDSQIVTVAGNGVAGYSGDGTATDEELNEPEGVAVDSAGNIIIADTVNNRIEQVNAEEYDNAGVGAMITLAGDGTAGSQNSEFDDPTSVAVEGVDATRTIFVSDSGNSLIREVTPYNPGNFLDGTSVTTLAGTGVPGNTGDNGIAGSAEINPDGIALDPAGDLFIAQENEHIVREIVATGGQISAYSDIVDAAGDGNENFGYHGDGGPAIDAGVRPFAVATDVVGNLYIADTLDNRIRAVTAGAIVTVTEPGGGGAEPGAAAATAVESAPESSSVVLLSTASASSFAAPSPVDHTASYVGNLKPATNADAVDQVMSQQFGGNHVPSGPQSGFTAARPVSKAPVASSSVSATAAESADSQPSDVTLDDDFLELLAASSQSRAFA
jgi:NHL repeat